MFFAGTSQHQYYARWLSIERTKNASGRDTTEGVLIASAGDGGTNCFQQFFQNGAGPTTRETTLGVLLPTFGTGSSGTSVSIYPVFLSKGVFFSAEQRRLLWNSGDARRCVHCKKVLTWANFQVDHIRAHSKGGRTRLYNADLSCASCNASKGARRRARRR